MRLNALNKRMAKLDASIAHNKTFSRFIYVGRDESQTVKEAMKAWEIENNSIIQDDWFVLLVTGVKPKR